MAEQVTEESVLLISCGVCSQVLQAWHASPGGHPGEMSGKNE
ncbi:MAG: hypothetical protein ACRCT4_01005 [Silvania sp.]